MGLKDKLQESALFRQVRDAWGRMPKSRRVLVAATAAAVFGGLAYVVLSQPQIEFRELMHDLEPREAASLRDTLDKQGIPYRIEDGGRVLVPAEQVARARLDAAQAGLPAGGGLGYELFDRQDPWLDEGTKRVNFRRALEGELTRSVRALEGVEAARVHLVIPEPHIFKEQQKEPTASIMVRLRPGHRLNDKQIKGLRILVASAVEGLAPERVALVDHVGAVIAQPGTDDAAGMQAALIEQKRGVEISLETGIVRMLEPVVGSGKVLARVSADVDFTTRRATVEDFDAEEPAIGSERRSTETRGRTQPRASGVAGAKGNGDAAAGPDVATDNEQQQDESVNYLVDKTVRLEDEPPGRMKRLSVAVLVDGRRKHGAATEEGQPDTVEYVPFTPEELSRFTGIVKNAVGFDESRGDRVTVENMPFAELEVEPLPVEPFVPRELVRPMMNWGFLLVVLLVAWIGVVRPLLKPARVEAKAEAAKALAEAQSTAAVTKQLEAAVGVVSTDGTTPAGASTTLGDAALPGALPPGEVPARLALELRTRAVELSRADARRAAQVLRSWLQTEQAVPKV